MTVWLIEPHDPLIVRDGKPFGPNPGARATSLAFPFPSTTTGGARTRAGLDDKGNFNIGLISTVKGIEVRGPLLVELAKDGTAITNWLFPAPADALLFAKEQDEQSTTIIQLVPLHLFDKAETDFDSKNADGLWFVGLSSPNSNKPAKNAPRYWNQENFMAWLLDPQNQERQIKELGHNGPAREQRLHVSIDPNTDAAIDGALFETTGLEFTHTDKHQLQTARRLALAVIVNDKMQPTSGLAGFGGERRIVSWQKSESSAPQCPKQLEDQIVKDGACRIILLTPAYFKGGYKPAAIEQPGEGITPKLKAIAIQRPQVVSGWDFVTKGPKPTRRLAPAGTVLFLSLKDHTNEAAIRKWVQDTWMHCLSDDPQDNRDGFGLAILGTWSGKPTEMKLNEQKGESV
jgi:CRISPR-associated protein Cmr3